MSQTETLLNSGQKVKIVDAEPGTPDPKSLVYYDYYRNLVGTVVKAYPDGSVAVSVDRDTLPDPIRKRHESSEKSMRDKWLAGLSDEDRNKLSAKEKQFNLRYTLLVSAKNVVPENGEVHSLLPDAKKQSQLELTPPSTATPTRKTLNDLSAAEQAYLDSKNQ